MPSLHAKTMSALAGGLMLVAGAALGDTAEPMRAMPLELSVPSPPSPVRADGKAHLVYELHMTNFDPRGRDLKLVRLEVAAGAGAKPLLTLEGEALAGVLLQPGRRDAPDKSILGGGIRGVAFLWVDLDEGAPVPSELVHRVTIQGETGEKTLEGGRTPVRAGSALVLGPPLRGGDWVAAVGPSNASGHRRTFITLDGRPRIAQRFAVDFARLSESGLPFQGDPTKNGSWFGYGQEVLAVADGVIASVQDGIKENIPLAPEMAVAIDVNTAGGNYVILDLGDGRYAFFAHMQPGSLKVKAGDRVKRGQVLGLLGNSGNSDAPHLHFHVADADSPLGSEGQPYVFDGFEIEGRIDSIDPLLAGQPAKLSPSKEPRRREIPTENVIVRFP
jgi:murein DD-endopeptidase